MRRPITLALALFVACSSDKVGPPPAPPVNWASLQPQPRPDAGQLKPTEREALVASAYAKALADFGTLPKLLGESANMRFGKQTAHGREAALAMHESIFGAFAQRTVATSRVWMNERYQAIEFSITGSQTRDWMGLAATQKQATIKGIMLVWTSDDGSIEDVHVMFDVAQVKAQLLGAATQGTSPAARVFESTASPDEATNVQAVRDSLDALEVRTHESQRLDAGKAAPLIEGEAGYLSTFTDDVELYTGRPDPLHGKDQAKAHFRSMRASIGQLDTLVNNTLGAGAFVIVEYTISGEQQGPIGNIPFKSSQLVTLNVIDVVELRDHKIAHVWRYDNPSEIVSH